MPVVIKPTPQRVGTVHDKVVPSSTVLLENALAGWPKVIESFKKSKEQKHYVLGTSFSDLDPIKGGENNSSGVETSKPVIAYDNGFVMGMARAFEQDLHVVLRPDDVWLAILAQFSIYVNTNAKYLRGIFVGHDGKSRPASGFLEETGVYDAGKLARMITLSLDRRICDKELREWIIPDFSTTSQADRSVAALFMMGTLQEFAKYSFTGGCGYPSVTLLGESEDWAELLRRVDRFENYGQESYAWSKQLKPVLKRMLASFLLPDSQDVKDFWLRACYSNGLEGCGAATLSGWLTAFCFWSKDGECLDESLYAKKTGIDIPEDRDSVDENLYAECVQMELDGVKYHFVTQPNLPSGIARGIVSVPITGLVDAGEFEYETTVIAGLVGMTVTKNEEDEPSLQPRSGWWMLDKSLAGCS